MSPSTEKKGLKNYLMEGLMIFVAVMLGFFAESLRENIGDRQRESDYIKSLTTDIQQDTASLAYTIRVNQNKIAGLDSILSLAKLNLDDQSTRRLLYQYSLQYISFYSAFSSSDATMMQLKNSGGLQYIQHAHVADSIAVYDSEMRSIYAAEAPYAKAVNDAMDELGELVVYRINSDTLYKKNGKFKNKDLPLLSHDPQKVDVFFNKVYMERGWTLNYVNNLKRGMPYSIRMLTLLKKEYGE